ncbi:MAG: nucleotidyltransferase domain-containing protein [Candidatus Bathyarchaeia archaeon]
MFPKERLKKEAYEKIRDFVKQVKPLNPRLIILYGSYARGDYTESSDIDVCVVAERLPEDIFRRRSLSGLHKVKNLNPIGYHPNEFLEELKGPNLFLYDVLREGVVIYDDGFLEEARGTLEEEIKRKGIVKSGDKWMFNV